MQASPKSALQEQIAFSATLILIIGLLVSKFMITLSMIGFIFSGLINRNRKKHFIGFCKHPAYLATTGIFFIIFLSGLYTSNWENMAVRLRVALPFLILPFAFALIGNLPKHFYHWINQFLILSLSVASVGVLLNYALDYQNIQQLLTVSKAVPTPNKDHIRFSLLLCIGVFTGIATLRNSAALLGRLERYLVVGIIFFLIATLHILSVRSGLLALYIGMLVLAVQIIVQHRRFLFATCILISLVIAPVLAYYTFPSFRAKLKLTQHNLLAIEHNEIGEYSDTQRLLSYKIAWEVAQKNFWFGVGMGDLYDEQQIIYAQRYPNLSPKYPHNQFLTFLCGTGIIGLALFIFCFLLPFFYLEMYKDSFGLSFYAIIFSSFLVENTLLITLGTTIYTFFILININKLSN